MFAKIKNIFSKKATTKDEAISSATTAKDLVLWIFNENRFVPKIVKKDKAKLLEIFVFYLFAADRAVFNLIEDPSISKRLREQLFSEFLQKTSLLSRNISKDDITKFDEFISNRFGVYNQGYEKIYEAEVNVNELLKALEKTIPEISADIFEAQETMIEFVRLHTEISDVLKEMRHRIN